MPIAFTAWGLEKRAIHLPVAPKTAEDFIAVIFFLVLSTTHTEAPSKNVWMFVKRRTCSHWWWRLCAHWNVTKRGKVMTTFNQLNTCQTTKREIIPNKQHNATKNHNRKGSVDVSNQRITSFRKCSEICHAIMDWLSCFATLRRKLRAQTGVRGLNWPSTGTCSPRLRRLTCSRKYREQATGRVRNVHKEFPKYRSCTLTIWTSYLLDNCYKSIQKSFWMVVRGGYFVYSPVSWLLT